jgi:hypothetical protein
VRARDKFRAGVRARVRARAMMESGAMMLS